MKLIVLSIATISFLIGVLFANSHLKHCNRSIVIERNLCGLQSSCHVSTVSSKNDEIAINIIHNSESGKWFASCTFPSPLPYILISASLSKARWVISLLRKARCSLCICQHTLFHKWRFNLFSSNENTLQIHTNKVSDQRCYWLTAVKGNAARKESVKYS